MAKKLTVKQDNFTRSYILNGGNATQAALEAGYKGNLKTLQRVGYENLLKPLILKAIEVSRNKEKKRFSISFEDKQKMLLKNYRLGQSLGQISAANGAVAELNRMDGDIAAEKRHIQIVEPEKLIIELC